MVMGEGSPNAKVLIVGEAPGAEEERTGHPFVGASGQELNRMLFEAGLIRSECFVTNVCRVRPPGNDIEAFIALRKADRTPAHLPLRDKYVTKEVIAGWELLQKEIATVKPNVIIPMGNVALWALTGKWGVRRWRGSMMMSDLGPKVIPTFHPAAILRQWELRHITLHDLRRAASEQDSREYTKPNYSFIIRPSFETALSVLQELHSKLELEPRWLSFDLETDMRTKHIRCAGIAWSKTEAICIPLTCKDKEEGYWSEEEETFIVHWLYRVLTHKNAQVIGQNLLFDCQYTYRYWHFIPRVHLDTMIAHHVCFPGLPKALDFQASMYCSFFEQWKPEKGAWKAGG